MKMIPSKTVHCLEKQKCKALSIIKTLNKDVTLSSSIPTERKSERERERGRERERDTERERERERETQREREREREAGLSVHYH